MRILIVGANSFLARSLAHLLDEGNTSISGVFHRRTDHINHDIFTDLVQTREMARLDPSFDVVYILAASINHGTDQKATALRDAANVALPNAVCAMFPNARVVFASTVSVYSPQRSPIDERVVPRPLNSYGASKLRGEEAVRRHNNAVIVRFSSLYGPGMRTSTFLPILVRQALHDRELRLWGRGQRMQDYLHVRDAAMMLVRAAASASRGPLLGVYGTSFSNIAIAKTLSGLCGDVPIRFVQSEDSSPSFRYSAAASHQIMKFEPQIAINDGLKELVEHG